MSSNETEQEIEELKKKQIEPEKLAPEETSDATQEEEESQQSTDNKAKRKLITSIDKLMRLTLNRTVCKDTEKVSLKELEDAGFSEALIDVIQFYLPKDNKFLDHPIGALVLGSIAVSFIVIDKEPLKKQEKPKSKVIDADYKVVGEEQKQPTQPGPGTQKAPGQQEQKPAQAQATPGGGVLK